MNTIRAMFLALGGTAFVLPGAALADPVLCPFNNHHYEVIDFDCSDYNHEPDPAAACWHAALDAASDRTYAGAQGKLLTITSPQEQACVDAAWTAWKNAQHPTKFEVWIGGLQQQPGPHDPPIDVGENWFWIDGDEIPGTNFETGYANWRDGEPNDLPRSTGHPEEHPIEDGDEDYLGFGLGNEQTWNDEGRTSNIAGIGIEYETATEFVDLKPCLNPGGCTLPLSDELEIIYEDIVCMDSMDQSDPTCSAAGLTSRSWQVLDPRAVAVPTQCGHKLLNLFLDTNENLSVQVADEPNPLAVSTLPRHLCGHDTIVVTRTVVENFKIGEKASIVVSNPPIDSTYQKCGPLDLASPIDNTVWDVTAYQTTDKAEMVETHVPMTGINQLFAGGSVFESVFDCQSSRGKGFRDSWYFSGLCIAFGGDGCPTASPDFMLNPHNFNLMNAFLIYKLRRTIDVLDEAKANHAFKRRSDYRYMRRQLTRAIWKTRRGYYRAALYKIKAAQRRLARTRFRDVPEERYPAELDARLSNAVFTSKERIVQYLNLH